MLPVDARLGQRRRQPRANFHIGPDAGLDKGYAGSDDVIDLKYSILKTIGYECMPQIANAFCESADAGMAGGRQQPVDRATTPASSATGSAWTSTASTTRGRTSIYRVQPLMNDTAAEVVAAGVKLAVAAGYIEDTDGSVQSTLGDELQGHPGRQARLGERTPTSLRRRPRSRADPADTQLVE